jgi:L-glyceraldehyde 3-phosphate reductase
MNQFSKSRYENMDYRRAGNSGLLLPALSIGCWHNFGFVSRQQTARDMLAYAFDHGVTHFDLANNYGPPPGSAESVVGSILKSNFHGYRDELIISTKAGYGMYPGPYGEWGSKKYLTASLDASLKRLQLDYVDIFYSHRFDPNTPLEETLEAICQLVRQGKALYAGISNYSAEHMEFASRYFKEAKVPFILNQVSYSMFQRGPEENLFQSARDNGVGIIAFCPLAQGLLTDRYLQGIPADSRAADSNSPFLSEKNLAGGILDKVKKLDEVAKSRGQSLARLALQWALRENVVTSLIIGASRVSQIEENLKILKDPALDTETIARIDSILGN